MKKDRSFLGPEAAVPLEKARFVILPCAYERTTSYRKGTLRGPELFLEASEQIEFYDEELGMETFREAAIATLPIMRPKKGESPGAFMGRLSAIIESCLTQDKMVITIGGEHTLTYASVEAYARHLKQLSLLHFDAHADLRPSYEDNYWSHACALRRSIEACQQHQVNYKVAMVGIRSLDIEEARYIERNPAIKLFDPLRHRDIRLLTEQVLAHLGSNVYVTLDLDGFDPAVIPGVGTPQPGGFGWYEALDLLRAVFQKKRVVGFDLMELSPVKGEVVSELAAAKLAYRLIGYALRSNASASASKKESQLQQTAASR